MWHRYAKRTIGWLCPSSSRCKEVRGQPQRDRGRTLGTVCTCEEIEKGAYACIGSKLGPVERWWTQDGKLGITIQDPPPESGRRTHLLYVTYSYCILSRVWKLATSLLVLRYYEHLFLFSMLILQVTSSRFCLYLLNMCPLPTHFHMHIQRHTHTSTHVQSAHKRNANNQAQEPGWERRKKGFVRDLAHTKKNLKKKPIFTNLKATFEHIELPAKLLDYFLRSNKEQHLSIFSLCVYIYVTFGLYACMHLSIYPYIYIHTCVYICVHTYIFTYMYMLVNPQGIGICCSLHIKNPYFVETYICNPFAVSALSICMLYEPRFEMGPTSTPPHPENDLVWPCKLPFDSLPLQQLAKSLKFDLRKLPRWYFSITVAGKHTCWPYGEKYS